VEFEKIKHNYKVNTPTINMFKKEDNSINQYNTDNKGSIFSFEIIKTIHNFIFYNNVIPDFSKKVSIPNPEKKGEKKQEDKNFIKFDHKYKKLLSIARLLLIAFICIAILTPLNAVNIISGSGSSSILKKTPNMMVLKQVFLYWVDIMVFFLLFLELVDFHDIETIIYINNKIKDKKDNLDFEHSGNWENFLSSMFSDVEDNSYSMTHFILSLLGVIGYMLFHVNTFLVNYIA